MLTQRKKWAGIFSRFLSVQQKGWKNKPVSTAIKHVVIYCVELVVTMLISIVIPRVRLTIASELQKRDIRF